VGCLLALDVGEKRIGVAISDATQTLARPLMTLRRASKREDFEAIAQLIAIHDVQRVIVGMPWTLRGEEGAQARRVRRYAEALSATIAAPIAFQDERLSSVEAERRLASGSRRRSRDKGELDAAAAAVILQDYLNRQKTDE
jgi:putative Holliday junction resolvase